MMVYAQLDISIIIVSPETGSSRGFTFSLPGLRLVVVSRNSCFTCFIRLYREFELENLFCPGMVSDYCDVLNDFTPDALFGPRSHNSCRMGSALRHVHAFTNTLQFVL